MQPIQAVLFLYHTKKIEIHTLLINGIDQPIDLSTIMAEPYLIKTIRFSDGSCYEGQVNAIGEQHGKGTFSWSNGARFEGQFKNNKKHGRGWLLFPDHITMFMGTYDNNHKSHGTMYYKDGRVYCGKWVTMEQKGIILEKRNDGTETQKTGEVYSIMLKDGEEVQTLIKECSVLPIPAYKGELNMAGEPHGKGVMTMADGRIYKGTFVNGLEHGRGQFTDASGTYHMLTRHGQDVSKIRLYPKEACNVDKKNGYVHMKHSNGDEFKGEAKNGAAHGTGIMVYADKSYYEGSFENGVHHGYGLIQDTQGVCWAVISHRGKYVWRTNLKGILSEKEILGAL